MSQLDQLISHLRSRKDPILERAIAEAMTINETSPDFSQVLTQRWI
jgi:hypothetical protein